MNLRMIHLTKKLTKKFDKWLHSHLSILLALILLVVLRVPNFFEPYWYGDEGIYLTIGNALRQGELLYTDIVDHKTPIIYYLASVPNQLSFRVLNLIWMGLTTMAFYSLVKKLIKNSWGRNLSLLTFVLLTSLPWFEGNIPNGELFVMGFVIWGGWILSKTKISEYFLNAEKLNTEKKEQLLKKVQLGKLYVVGVLFGLGIMTKVPGIMDVVAWMTLFWFALYNHTKFQLKNLKRSFSDWFALLGKLLPHLLVIGLGILTPILASILYYVSLGSGADYLEFGLLYNFHYAGNWSLPFDSQFLTQVFTLQGKVAIAALVYLLLTFKKKWFSPAMQLTSGWFALSLVGALLSNRPYPHYFQQVLPAFALLIGIMLDHLLSARKTKSKKVMCRATVATGSILIFLGVAALKLLDFGAYPAWEYYQRTYKLLTGKISTKEYRQAFNYLMNDNYQAAEIIKKSGTKQIFIWGTNPMLYALSDTNPTGRFTVSFHIKDLGVYEETMQDVRDEKPLFIVKMNDEHTKLPGLESYLQEHYVVNDNFLNFTLWKRLPDSTSVSNL